MCVYHVMSGLRQSRDVSADGGQIPALNNSPHRLLKLRPYLGRLAAGSALTTQQTDSHLISAPDVVWPRGVGFPSEPLHGYLRTGASVLARPCIWFLNLNTSESLLASLRPGFPAESFVSLILDILSWEAVHMVFVWMGNPKWLLMVGEHSSKYIFSVMCFESKLLLLFPRVWMWQSWLFQTHLPENTGMENRSRSQISHLFNPSQKRTTFSLGDRYIYPTQEHLNKVTQIISRSTQNDGSIKQMYVENFHWAALTAAQPNLFSIHELAA